MDRHGAERRPVTRGSALLSISSLGLASHLVYSQHLVRPELKQVHGSKTSGTIFHFPSQEKKDFE